VWAAYYPNHQKPTNFYITKNLTTYKNGDFKVLFRDSKSYLIGDNIWFIIPHFYYSFTLLVLCCLMNYLAVSRAVWNCRNNLFVKHNFSLSTATMIIFNMNSISVWTVFQCVLSIQGHDKITSHPLPLPTLDVCWTPGVMVVPISIVNHGRRHKAPTSLNNDVSVTDIHRYQREVRGRCFYRRPSIHNT
jgi:hypothetical protein